MGNSIDRKVHSIKKKLGVAESNSHKDNTIGIEFACPNCNTKFGPKSHQSQVNYVLYRFINIL